MISILKINIYMCVQTYVCIYVHVYICVYAGVDVYLRKLGDLEHDICLTIQCNK